MANLLDAAPFADPAQAVDFVANVLESSTEYSIIGQDLNGKILLWNEGARRIYGYEAADVVGTVNADILHDPADVAAGRPAEMRASALSEGKWEGTVIRKHRDGRPFAATVVLTPRRDVHGDPVGFLLISRDISRDVGRFKELKHDLRNPLNVILGFTGTLLMGLAGPLDDEQYRQLEAVQSAGNDLLSIINDLPDP